MSDLLLPPDSILPPPSDEISDSIPLDEVPLEFADPRWPPSKDNPGYYLTHCPNHYASPGTLHFERTRIVRIHRDYATPRERDTPTFVDAYPGFPLSLYMREGEFADLIAEVNYMLDLAFSPRAWGNIVDAVVGVASCWLSEVFYKSYHKRKILELESFLEELNAEVYAPRGIRVISLRRSAFMSLDIEIPYPFPYRYVSEIKSGAAEKYHPRRARHEEDEAEREKESGDEQHTANRGAFIPAIIVHADTNDQTEECRGRRRERTCDRIGRGSRSG